MTSHYSVLPQASLFIYWLRGEGRFTSHDFHNPSCIVYPLRQGLVDGADTRRRPLILLSLFAGNTIGPYLTQGTGRFGSIPRRIPLDVNGSRVADS
jgi:hypothetical protein